MNPVDLSVAGVIGPVQAPSARRAIPSKIGRYFIVTIGETMAIRTGAVCEIVGAKNVFGSI